MHHPTRYIPDAPASCSRDIGAIHPEGETANTPCYTEVKVAEATLSQIGTLIVILAISLELLEATEAIAHGREGSDPCTDRDMTAHGEEDRSVIKVTQTRLSRFPPSARCDPRSDTARSMMKVMESTAV